MAVDSTGAGIRESLYRPFCKQYLYYGRDLNSGVYQMPAFMPLPTLKNIFIGVVGRGQTTGFSAFITDVTPNLHLLATGQWFAMYSYKKENNLFNDNGGYIREDNISDYTLLKYKKIYGDKITKEDIFFYIYGLLHLKEYREKFANFIIREIPRIPLVKYFEEFSNIGKELANLHINYENVKPLDEVKITINSSENFNVDKMKFLSTNNKKDKSTIIYNENITISNIPKEAYKYIVNGRSGIEWVMDRYKIKKDKNSGLINDPNLYKGSKYIFDLLQSVIAVSVKSIKLIESLPKLELANLH